MNENIISHILIEKFKCFNNFKLEGLNRVNLIGGENNVGKTSFMEACLLLKAESTKDLYKRLLEIKTHRNIVSNILSTTDRQRDLQGLIVDNFPITIQSKNENVDKLFQAIIEKNESYGMFYIGYSGNPHCSESEYTYSELFNTLNISLRNTKYHFSPNFISPYSNLDEELTNIIGEAKLEGKYDDINKNLEEIFDISAIDIIKNKPMLKKGNKYYHLSDFGQGIKTFINTIGSMALLENSIICIDEIENGIHYSHLDKFWEIVLTLSKKQNIQVFATTHSKECIESYARVAKRLEDKEITFVELGRDDNHEIKAMVYPYQWFLDEIEQEHEVRGW